MIRKSLSRLTSPRPSNGPIVIVLSLGLILVLLDHYVLGAEVIASALVFWHQSHR